jgi:hypothetical protein
VAHMRLCRDTLVPLLQAIPGVASDARTWRHVCIFPATRFG